MSFAFTGLGRALGAVFGSPARRDAFMSGAQRIVPAPLRPIVSRLVTRPVPAMRDEDRRFLVEYFRAPNTQLRELLGLTLDHWSS